MITRRIVLPRGGRDEGEKPFWISFADLMSALMVLFLVALTIELNKANEQKEALKIERDNAEQLRKEAEQSRTEAERAKAELETEKRKQDDRSARRTKEIDEFTMLVQKAVDDHVGVTLKENGTVIDFGSRALFQNGEHRLTHDQINTLRQFTPDLLKAVRSDVGKKWLRRIVVEGFTSWNWLYLQNLHLSLQRSERVLCALLAENWEQANMPADPATPLAPLGAQDRSDIKRLSLVGGYSSNSAKNSADESRRIELRLEFFQQEELEANARRPLEYAKELPTGKCPI